MSDKTVSERDALRREQVAFEAGACWQRLELGAGDRTGMAAQVAMETARERYPLPKVERPRVVRDPHIEGIGDRYEWIVLKGENTPRFRLVGTHGRWYLPDGHEGGAFTPTRERVAMWADLLANPVELVEDADAAE